MTIVINVAEIYNFLTDVPGLLKENIDRSGTTMLLACGAECQNKGTFLKKLPDSGF